jgi:hypothetical protein
MPPVRLAELSRLIAGLAIYISCTCFAQAEILRGRVVKIADGDTLTVLDESKRQHKIRLVGIDAPERKQAFGTVSRQNLADLVFGKTVAVSGTNGTAISVSWEKCCWMARTSTLSRSRGGWPGITSDMTRISGDLINAFMPRPKRMPVSRALDCGMILHLSPPWDFRRNKPIPSVADEGCEIRLAGFRYRIDPVICGIYRNALKSVSALSGLMGSARPEG